MQRFDYRLNLFSGYAKDVKTPEELFEAIDKLGPLPLYRTIGVNNKQEDDIYDFESAKKEAHIVYEFARRIAISLRKSKQIQTPLPPPQTDPFLGISTIKEWCIDVSQKQPTSGKAGETEQNTAIAKKEKSTEKKNKGRLKRIRNWIYILTVFLAALLTCLYYLDWLEPIKAFIYRILWHK